MSKNSIIVGALNKSMNDVSSYSQFGNDLNYISVVAPGEFVFTDTKKVTIIIQNLEQVIQLLS
ncbi:hypothetical protein [Mycoplasmopsis felis]|uniref:hypothetical protein n=1 Tax=Mycoplasmopsis felis TaxID=33923 RepID=UPI002FF2963C